MRFQDAMKSASVKMLRIRDNVFILLNSMALEGDGCSMCSLAETKLRGMATQLRCAKVCATLFYIQRIPCLDRVLARI